MLMALSGFGCKGDRYSERENQQLKRGEIPADWQDKPHRLAQKDTNAR